MDKEIITKTLSVKLTDQELLEFSKKLATFNQDLMEAELQKKEVVADYSAKIKSLQASIGSTSRVIANEEEFRKIECQWFYPKGKKIKNLKRLDTNEIVEIKNITQEDRQGDLGLDISEDPEN